MESISATNNAISSINKNTSQEMNLPADRVASAENQLSTPSKDKYLQPDQVDISEASRKKLSESEETQKKSFSISNKTTAKEEVSTKGNADESDIDKEIRELSLEILELTIQIEMLKSKEDKKSVQERQALETELAIKKGTLDATIARKLQMAGLSK